MRLRTFVICCGLALVSALTVTMSAIAADGGRPFTTTLTGAAEVPGPGDPDGSGTASLTLNPGQAEVCWDISVSNITLPATAAHIHVGTATESGPVVVGLSPPGANGTSSGCTSADPTLIKAIIKNPENYYVNVHTLDFPAGAVRGQLSK
jgi:CHRD domain